MAEDTSSKPGLSTIDSDKLQNYSTRIDIEAEDIRIKINDDPVVTEKNPPEQLPEKEEEIGREEKVNKVETKKLSRDEAKEFRAAFAVVSKGKKTIHPKKVGDVFMALGYTLQPAKVKELVAEVHKEKVRWHYYTSNHITA